jgi:hypothetical protein
MNQIIVTVDEHASLATYDDIAMKWYRVKLDAVSIANNRV